jgi:hypothetical protein
VAYALAQVFGAFALVIPGGSVAPQPWQSWAQANRMPQPPIAITLKLTDYGCENEATTAPIRGERTR